MPTGKKPAFGRYDEHRPWSRRWAGVIGRCQIFHHGHFRMVNQALATAENVLVLLGSYRRAMDPKNPWTVEQREEMIRACFSPYDNDRLHFDYVRDYWYNDPAWQVEVQGKILQRAQSNKGVALVGYYKDRSSDWLKSFPQWDLVNVEGIPDLNATDLRMRYFTNWRDMAIDAAMPAPARQWLNQFVRHHQDHYEYLVDELNHYRKYWKDWEGTPYPVVFSCTDAVVFKSGHVLVVTRRQAPGKGLYALPGGFLKEHLTRRENCIEELKEETSIGVDRRILRDLVANAPTKEFDYPGRSLRGRVVSDSFLLNLGHTGELPRVRGGDDAEHAMWMPIADVYLNEHRFFEDHADQIKYFLGKV